jgi:hypothetical protein
MIEWLNILAGLILCVGLLEALPFMGKSVAKFAKWLGGFDTIIGIILIIVVIWQGYLESDFLLGIVAIFAGLIMIVGILPLIPAVGKHLEKLAKWLGGFQTIIGLIVLIVGILGLIDFI